MPKDNKFLKNHVFVKYAHKVHINDCNFKGVGISEPSTVALLEIGFCPEVIL